MTRTDTHRPSAINPEDYVFVSFHDHRPDAAFAAIAEQQAFRAHMASTGGKFSGHDHGGVCHICGNVHAMTVARFWHQPTNTYIEVGETCAEKLLCGETLNFRSFREKVKAGVQAATGKRKAEAFCKEHGIPYSYDIWLANDYHNWGYEEATIADIISKLVKYGSISDKQIDFVAKLMKRIDERAAIAAQRKAEADAAAPIPAFEGRATVEGEIISRKGVDTAYGFAIKVVVKHADGWKVYGTLPAAIEDAERGDTVRFDAAIAVSDDDPKFGFFKRPTKAEITA